MTYSIVLLTATLACGAADARPAAPAQVQPAPVVRGSCCGKCNCPCCLRPTLLERLRALLHGRRCKSDCAVTYPCGCPCKQAYGRCCCKPRTIFGRICCRLFRRGQVCCCNSVVTVAVQSEPVKVAELLPDPPPQRIAPPPPPVVPASSPNEIRREYLSKVGNADDYSWVTGQLYYIHADGGLWVVRYAPIDKEDRYGGSVILALATPIGDCQEGDLVKVTGEILYEGRASKFLGAALYRAGSIQRMERYGR